jgi:hypothetical protein
LPFPTTHQTTYLSKSCLILVHTTHPHPPWIQLRKTNWNLLKEELSRRLPTILNLSENISPDKLDEYAEKLTAAIKESITHTTPRKKPCPHSKRWWNDDLSELRLSTSNIYRRTKRDVDEDEWKELRRRYKMEIRVAKEKKWKEFVEEADEKTIWMVKKYIDKPPAHSHH